MQVDKDGNAVEVTDGNLEQQFQTVSMSELNAITNQTTGTVNTDTFSIIDDGSQVLVIYTSYKWTHFTLLLLNVLSYMALLMWMGH